MIGRRKPAARATSAPRARSATSQLIAKLGHPGTDPRHGRKRKPLPFKPQGPPGQAGSGASSFLASRRAISRLRGRQNVIPEGPGQSHGRAHRIATGCLGSGHGRVVASYLGEPRNLRLPPCSHPGHIRRLLPARGLVAFSYGSAFGPAGRTGLGSTLGFEGRSGVSTFRGCGASIRGAMGARAAAGQNNSGGLKGRAQPF